MQQFIIIALYKPPTDFVSIGTPCEMNVNAISLAHVCKLQHVWLLIVNGDLFVLNAIKYRPFEEATFQWSFSGPINTFMNPLVCTLEISSAFYIRHFHEFGDAAKSLQKPPRLTGLF